MFYNNQRLHAYLDYVSPALFERLSMKKAVHITMKHVVSLDRDSNVFAADPLDQHGS